ncbi:hypothetical protein A2291_07125 [candidate division WOR-1 bacterium RIFOXYB2_FULL_42_35]|uniref:Uncharacterized protein n=1 Tax=candidate division WOR-1 bacterium RIFOXYC2_FULL_41_25 TaxID=1802586 RepID=A0A1F4TKJ1_UNCSA|nr:MAG: hypothetical protein A2247_04465 [candidate division WOR-1 bacterium RIFOXYA2_FULL_41_14]OGC22478.1 MAG: hypothetical protein A2291_07125 [candidate division WOR-1 bacterium RIFOXYB2_FULL_42_35]OGC33216.1 MAG: hypothetical protein A2462_07300 [candidate division WOR-1 bacterium RIFOXYC2_FULL_41_25]
MTDQILEIGEAGLGSTDEKVRKLMDNMVGSEVPGYRKSDVVVRSFATELNTANQRLSAMKPQVEGTFYSNVQGALVKTDKKLDLALGSDGFFVLSGPWGEGYTRDGRFQLDYQGRLLSAAGNFPVMGKNGPIIVTPGADVEFTQNGEIKVDGTIVDTVRVVKPEVPGSLDSLNGSLFRAKNATAIFLEVETPRVIQGYIEASNVSIIDQMMEMIYLEKVHTLNTKIISTRDANLARAMELGKASQ